MENKILIADDSPTIQKVINITLANKDYSLDSAHSEEELLDKMESEHFDLILLDYNLSDTASGLDLAKQIKGKSAKTLVLAMLGTFDSVDDEDLIAAGFVDKVVKPFESSKFIQKIEKVLSTSVEEVSLDADIFSSNTNDDQDNNSQDESDDDFSSDEWSMDGPSVIEDESESSSFDELTSDNIENPLSAEMAGWGMSVPGVIGSGDKDSSDLFPPTIGNDDSKSFTESIEYSDYDEEDDISLSVNDNQDDQEDEDIQDEGLEAESETNEDLEFSAVVSEDSSEDIVTDDQSFPETEDLDYPDMDAISASEDNDKDKDKDEVESHPQLTSLDELDVDDDYEDDDLDVTDPQIIIGPSEDSPDLINEINDDISPDDFWAADVDEEEANSALEAISVGDEEEFIVEDHISIEDGPKSTNLSEESKATLEALSAINDIGPKLENESKEIGPKLESIDTIGLAQQIKTEILNELKPLLKEMIQEALAEANSSAAEKVAWEVIPDLAENLIRKEVQELSQKVRDKHSLN